ncbi:MAG: helix-turn-helix transcriptional regulator [bacterium]|nr:helix-turn-helix transcriptional regulator [bacterium]
MANETEKLIMLAKNIGRFRKSLNLSQNEFAEKLNISREHLAKLETAKRCISLKLLFKMCEMFNFKESDLFNFENFEN